MANAEQVRQWDGPDGEHWVAEQDRYDRMNAGFGERIVAALAPQPGERILDVGCGNGALVLSIAPLVAPDGSATGLDISGPMLDNAARRVAEAGLSNVRFEKGDAQVHALPEASFDGLVSRFGVMFFEDPVAAFANLARALRPGGRVVFACWQHVMENEWIIVPSGAALAHVPMPDLGAPGGPGPFAFAEPDRVQSVLGDAGYVDVDLEPVTSPMWFGTDVDDAVGFMKHSGVGSALMEDVDDDTAARAWAAVAEALQPYATPDGVVLSGAAWLVSARTKDA
jgi:SAM-dependent methyltransferase